jgi:hypothetical protein
VGLSRVIAAHLLQDREKFLLPVLGDGPLEQRNQRFLVGRDPWWKPERYTRVVGDAVSGALVEGTAAECSGKV